MKRLTGKTTERKLTKKEKKASKIVRTQAIASADDALRQKQRQLDKKLFGIFSPVKYTLQSMKEVYVPYEIFVFSYDIIFGGKKAENNRNSRLRRSGETGIVFDMNEVHGFHFDVKSEKLDLDHSKESISNGVLLPTKCTEKEAVESALRIVKWKILGRAYRNVANLEVVSKQKFYRPALELVFICRDKTYVKYAYRDIYGAENENIGGLRARLNS